VKFPSVDLHLELKLAPVKQKYSPMLPDVLRMASSFVTHEFGTGDRRVDRAITDAMNGLSTETEAFVRDLDGMNLDLNFDQNQRTVHGDFAIKLRGQESWLVQRSFDHVADTGPPPAIFWRAPKDADSAFYGRGVNAKAYEGLRHATDDLVDALLAQQSMDGADRKAIQGIIDRIFSGYPTMVSSTGHIDPPADAKDPADPKAVSAALGWHVYGLEEGSDRAMGLIKELAAAYNKPSMQKWLRTKAKSDAKFLPTARVAPFAAKGITGAQALEIKVTIPEPPAFPEGPGAKKPQAPKNTAFSVFLVVMPDGPRTWMALSADRAAIESHLLAVKTGAPDSGTIAARSGIDQIKSTRAVSAGFITFAGLASRQNHGLAQLIGRHSEHKLQEAISRIPNHGETPILLMSTVEPGTPSTTSLQFQISKGTIDDIASFMSSMAVGGHEHQPPSVPPPPPPPPGSKH
jgi:hypothetical protein